MRKIILFYLLFFTANIFSYELDMKHLEKDKIFFIFAGQYLYDFHYNSVPVENIHVIQIELITNIKKIKTIELIDHYSKMNLCRKKSKIKNPVIVKFKINPELNINHITTRIKVPCYNKTVKGMKISTIDIITTTSDNRIFKQSFTIEILIPG